MFSDSERQRIKIRLIVLFGCMALTLVLFEAHDLKGMLIVLAFLLILTSILIISALRCIKNVLTDKERKDVEELRDWKIFQLNKNLISSNSRNSLLLNLIVIIANVTRWLFFLTLLFITSSLIIEHNATKIDFFIVCSFTLIWFPILDNLFLRKINYVTLIFFKFVLMGGLLVLFKAINLI